MITGRTNDVHPALDTLREQLSLLAPEPVAPLFTPEVIDNPRGRLQGYTLFLAIVPELAAAQSIAEAAAGICRQCGLSDTRLSPERLHITLHAIADFGDTIPLGVVDAAMVAAARVVCPPMPIVFDRALSVTGPNAFVLRCDAGSDAAIARLRQMLALALRRVGLHPKASGTAHMTMLYGQHAVAELPIEPVCWTATRFALIVSHVGLGHHQWIGHWALTDRR
jgi:2'-5' RNA ligase